MGDRVGLVATAHEPAFGAAASEQSTKILCVYQDASAHRQIHHLLWGAGGIKLTLHIRVTIHLVAEMIQGVQQRL
jgi:hypothetical protein